MDFGYDARTEELRGKLLAFMDSHVYPAEQTFARQVAAAEAAGDIWQRPAVIDDLKAEARRQGMWNLFLTVRKHKDQIGEIADKHGAGLTNLQYAPLAEITGRSGAIAPEALNCAAPDTGNMEVLAEFGTPEQIERWLLPLLEGEIRSTFCMTEPDVASSDATNIATRIERDGDEYVINGRKWWSSGAMDPRCKLFIVMGKSDPAADRHRQQSMICVPPDTPGVTVKRSMRVFGFTDSTHGGHGEIEFSDVRVPAANLIAGEGDGFAIAQARLGPRPDPPLHAPDRLGRACARGDVPPHDQPDRLGQADRRPGRRAGLDRGVQGADRAGQAAGAEDRLADGHRRQQGRAHRDPVPSRSRSRG